MSDTIKEQLQKLKELEEKKSLLEQEISKRRQELSELLLNEDAKVVETPIGKITNVKYQKIKYRSQEEILEYLGANNLERYIEVEPAKEKISKDYEAMLKKGRLPLPEGVEIEEKIIPKITYY